MSLPNVLIGAILLVIVTLFGIKDRIEHRPREAAHPPTAAALAFQREQDAVAALRRQAEAVAAIQSPTETEDILPAGAGRTETFAFCTPCHSTAIVRRSGFPRAQWDDLMDWMVERHRMNPLEDDTRRLIVDYLAQHFGPRESPRGRNPFLN